MNEYIPQLIDKILTLGHSLRWIHDHSQIINGDVCFMLSYGRIVSEEWLAYHRHNLVVHASNLPQGKGWSPMSWQILEGCSKIPLTLFEASIELDAGPIYAQEIMNLKGHEMAPEWQLLQANTTINMCINWLKDYPHSASDAKPQSGKANYYRRRVPEDSRLNLQKNLEEQFSLLRIVDNEAYPAFFEINGHRYRIKIEPCDQMQNRN